ncbi:hypothetical protein SEA_HANK144_70 [Streptomyces phage Hank144]|uniref:DUF7417 domain-containing protein n=1 Tax=Streptomyces phage Hank144 TaxID=2301573 RepID=A0A385DNW9_9CAUD|nr:hypothetical protein KGG76_gp70 [Streptomyces phage Hank144]AXQ61123.1 hypothetical protein SEA_HANK144_70 [Streptomyces phage Hank144]
MGRMKDIAIDVMSYELGELDARETVELFSLLVKSGMAWTLQGSYGRTANELIHAGYLTQDGAVSEFAEEMLEELEVA